MHVDIRYTRVAGAQNYTF